MRGIAKGLAETLEGGRLAIIAVDVAEETHQLGEGGGIESAVRRHTVAGPRLKLLEIPPRLRHPDDRDGEIAVPRHGLQGREDLLVGEVAGGPEEDEGVGVRRRHHAPLAGSAGFSRWPPNSYRMADRSLLAKSASPRELKRS